MRGINFAGDDPHWLLCYLRLLPLDHLPCEVNAVQLDLVVLQQGINQLALDPQWVPPGHLRTMPHRVKNLPEVVVDSLVEDKQPAWLEHSVHPVHVLKRILAVLKHVDRDDCVERGVREVDRLATMRLVRVLG